MQKIQRGARRGDVQNPLVFYLSALLYALIVSLICAVSFAPLLALFLFEWGSGLQYLALLCPVLVILFVLPLRFSFAQALADRYHYGAFSLRTAFNFSLYGEKVAEGVLYVLHLIKWALPLAAACGVLYYLYYETDVFSLIKGVTDFGTAAAAIWTGVLNFILGIFGGSYTAPKGGIVEGVFAILAILGVCVLFLVWGVVRNSAYRYIWAEATELDKNPRFETRRSLRGRRFQQLGVALINLALLAPVFIVLNLLFDPKEAIEQLTNQYADALVAETALPVIALPYGKLALVFFACYLPLLPIRRVITSMFATARIRRQSRIAELSHTSGDGTGPYPPLYEDNPAAPDGRNA